MTAALCQKRINQTIKRAQEQGIDVSAQFLVECLFDLSYNEDSDDSLDGDCCLKDLANTQEQEQKQTKQMEMASVDKEKYTKRREKICIIKKAALIKENKPSGRKYFLQKKRKVKKSMFPIQRKKRKKEENEYFRSLNDLSKPMPKRFWYGRKRLY